MGGDSLDFTNPYDIGTVMVWAANILKVGYYVTTNNFYYVTHILSYGYKWVGIIPGVAQTIMMMENKFLGTDYDHTQLDRMINIIKVSGWTLAAILFPVRLILGDDIPGIDNSAEAVLDYWPSKLDLSTITSITSIIWWLSNGGSMMKMAYKLSKGKSIKEQLDWWNEWDVLEVLIWNFVMGYWSSSWDLSYALGLIYLQLPWAGLLWFLFDGDFNMEDMKEAFTYSSFF